MTWDDQEERSASLRTLELALKSACEENFNTGDTAKMWNPQLRKKTDNTSRRRYRNRWTAAGSDKYDPHLVGALFHSEIQRQGWGTRLSAENIVCRWADIVGIDIAEHCTSVLVKGNTLEVIAETTAWSTQLRLLQSRILDKIAQIIGPGILTHIKVSGPQGPSWRKGPRHIKGRGPRDTYG